MGILIIEAHINGVPGVEVQQVLALGPRVGSVDAPPEHRGVSIIAHHGHRGQVGRCVEGEGAGRPGRAVVHRRHDLGAVEQLLLLVGGEDIVLIHRSAGRVRRHLVGEPHPGGHGEVFGARQGWGHIAVAVFGGVVFVGRPVVDGAALLAHGAGVDAAVVEALAVLVADVDGQGTVVVHRRLGAGIGVVLHHAGRFAEGGVVTAPPVGPAVGVGR